MGEGEEVGERVGEKLICAIHRMNLLIIWT